MNRRGAGVITASLGLAALTACENRNTYISPALTMGMQKVMDLAGGASAGSGSPIITVSADQPLGDPESGPGNGMGFNSPSALGDCDFSGTESFDQNYVAPGAVLQDPTLPPGNVI